MLGTRTFLAHLILFSLTIILLLNCLYAFNLVGAVGVPSSDSHGWINTGQGVNYTHRYFGISGLIESFKNYFANDGAIVKFQTILGNIYDLMYKFNVNNLLTYIDQWGISIPNGLAHVLSVLGTVVNLLVNLPFISMTFVYVTFYFFYVVLILFTFVSYLIFLLNGYFSSILPNTQFGQPSDYTGFHWEIGDDGLPYIVWDTIINFVNIFKV